MTNFLEHFIFDAPDFLCEGDGHLEWLWRLKDEITAADVALDAVDMVGNKRQ